MRFRKDKSDFKRIDDLVKKKKFREALHLCEDIDKSRPKVHPDSYPTRMETIELLTSTGQIPINPVYNPNYSPPEYMATWMHWVDYALRKKRCDDVLSFCNEVLKIHSSNSYGWLWMGMGYCYDGEISTAFVTFKGAAACGASVTFNETTLTLTVIYSPNQIGKILGLSGKISNDERVDALVERGKALKLDGHREEADQVFREALEIEPNHIIALRFYSKATPDMFTSETWKGWGDFLKRTGKSHEAQEAYTYSEKLKKEGK
ncbi:MAG: hypothetical protein RTV72_11610 [Candidatus Thorarchaeota archaeon]